MALHPSAPTARRSSKAWATPQDSGNMKSASAESAIHVRQVEARTESRFQRFVFYTIPNTWGDAPG